MSMNMEKRVIYSIQNNEAVLNEDLVFYANDGTIDLDIVLNKIDYGADKYKVNILTPNNEVLGSFPELVCMDADKNLYLPYQFNVNNLPGKYKMQIILIQEEFNFLTLPEFEFVVKDNITGLSETNEYTKAIIDDSNIGTSVLRDSRATDNYVSEQWYTGDVITSGKMNNMVNGINKGIESAETAYSFANTAQNTAQSASLKADTAINGLAGKANVGHTHTKSDITDFPTKLSEFQNDIGAGGTGGTGDGHTHDNMSTLNNLTQFKLEELDFKPSRFEFESLSIDVSNNTSSLADITQQLPINLKSTLNEILQRLGVLEGYHKTQINAVPILYLTGDMTGMTDLVKKNLGVKLVDIYGDTLLDKRGDFKWQGASSLTYPKKNYSVSLKNTEDGTSYSYLFTSGDNVKCNYVFENWVTNTGFHLKANYQDYTMVRNVVGANLGKECCKANYPNGRIVVDGFPIVIYHNDVFLGCYTFNMKQDGSIWGFDSNNTNHIAYRINEVLGTADEIWSMSNMDYRADGTATTDTQAKLQRLIDFIRNSSDEEFKTNYAQYIDLQSFIDYWLFIDLGGCSDSTMNNITYATWDGMIWYACHYDLDICFGAYGHGVNAPTKDMSTLASQRFNPIWGKIERCFWNELVSRYNELKTQGKFTTSYIYNKFKSYQDKWGATFLQQERSKWSGRPNNNEDIDYIQTWLNERFNYIDRKYVATTTVPITGLNMNKATTTVNTGSTDTLTVTYTPSNTTQKSITWTTSNSAVATVSNGVVTGVANGTCTITATSTSNATIKTTCNVTVQTAIISVTGVTLNKSTTSINQGSSETLVATVVPSNATNKNVTWSSSNTGVATVTASGLVTGVASGSATITVTTVDGNKTATCNLIIKDPENYVKATIPYDWVYTLNKGTTNDCYGFEAMSTTSVFRSIIANDLYCETMQIVNNSDKLTINEECISCIETDVMYFYVKLLKNNFETTPDLTTLRRKLQGLKIPLGFKFKEGTAKYTFSANSSYIVVNNTTVNTINIPDGYTIFADITNISSITKNTMLNRPNNFSTYNDEYISVFINDWANLQQVSCNVETISGSNRNIIIVKNDLLTSLDEQGIKTFLSNNEVSIYTNTL